MTNRFPVADRNFDGTKRATVEIDRDRQMFSVRPHHRRVRYTLPLADVAEMVIWRCVKADLKHNPKRKRR